MYHCINANISNLSKMKKATNSKMLFKCNLIPLNVAINTQTKDVIKSFIVLPYN